MINFTEQINIFEKQNATLLKNYLV